MHDFDDDAASAARASAHEAEAAGHTRVDGAAMDAAVAAAAGGAPSDAPTTPAGLLHLQRAVGNAGVVQMMREGDDDPHGLSLLGSGGSPLDAGTRVQMESAIGADFSDVRVHAGGAADQSAKSLGAHAYTAGNDIVFAEGRYDPGSPQGQHTLAHELTHVVQQRSGPVDGTTTDTGVKVSDPSDQFERAAEANADRVTSLQTKTDAATAPVGGAPTTVPAVQRHAEEDEVQGLFVQRHADEAEEAPAVQGMFDAAAGTVQREGDDEEEPG